METKTKHIILGAGGAIGNVLVNELLCNNESVKLVGRNPKPLKGVEIAKADINYYNEILNVIEENSIVYLLVGLKYDYEVWKEQWPVIMRSTIDACIEKNARLIFFDNVYMYGKVEGKMTEETLFNPCSNKGKVRAEIANMLLNEMNHKTIKAMIARSADFYGPYAEKTSIPAMFVFDKHAKGKKAQWLINAKLKHSFTFTPDCGKALYMLAKAEDAYGQTWHLPTAHPPITGEEFIKISADIYGVKTDYSIMKKWMVKIGGLFITMVKEAYEMLYQNEFDYEFDSTKFEKRFNFTPTSYQKGIKETIDFYKSTTVK
ncbi:MAG: NAD-dependent epimerase/dehydratase family protein [Bacteroidota bacterium]